MQSFQSSHIKIKKICLFYKIAFSVHFREQYVRKIQEQENLAKGLREQQKSVRDGQQGALHQMKIWRDLERLMDCKRMCLERQAGRGGGAGAGMGYTYMEQPPAMLEDDRLVL